MVAHPHLSLSLNYYYTSSYSSSLTDGRHVSPSWSLVRENATDSRHFSKPQAGSRFSGQLSHWFIIFKSFANSTGACERVAHKMQKYEPSGRPLTIRRNSITLPQTRLQHNCNNNPDLSILDKAASLQWRSYCASGMDCPDPRALATCLASPLQVLPDLPTISSRLDQTSQAYRKCTAVTLPATCNCCRKTEPHVG